MSEITTRHTTEVVELERVVEGVEPLAVDPAGRWALFRGDALALLPRVRPGAIDMLYADPPYASGGAMRVDRAKGVKVKYGKPEYGMGAMTAFMGDQKDGMTQLLWMAAWLAAAQDALHEGSAIALWSDWRQDGLTAMAIQFAGYVLRGKIPWIKTGYRPQPGQPGSSAEYCLWGSVGPWTRKGPPQPGDYLAPYPNAATRAHMTEKPLIPQIGIVDMCEPGGLVLDPFAGSASSGLAALASGRRYVGFELEPAIARVAAERLGRASALIAEERARAAKRRGRTRPSVLPSEEGEIARRLVEELPEGPAPAVGEEGLLDLGVAEGGEELAGAGEDRGGEPVEGGGDDALDPGP